MIKIILLTLGVCSDLLATAAAYGASGIRIPPKSAGVVSFVGTAALWCALMTGGMLPLAVSEQKSRLVGGVILIAFGVFTIFQKKLSALYRRLKKDRPQSHMMEVILDEKNADRDNSKELSLKEATVLGFALSADSFVSGLASASGLTFAHKQFAALAAFAAGTLFIMAGQLSGRLIFRHVRTRLDLSGLSGAFIAALGVALICG